MTIEELNAKLENANSIIEQWSRTSGDIEDLPKAIYEALEANRESIIEYLKEREN